MDLDSLASVVLWVTIALLILGVQPWKTFAAMGKAIEHRDDRYSTSMRIVNVDELGYMTACDDDEKGTVMLSSASTSIMDDVYVARVRAERRKAIGRRRILVLSLAVITLVVLVLAFATHITPAIALIPAALEAAVLALGARAAKSARAWEAKVAQSRKAQREAQERQQAHVTRSANRASVEALSGADAEAYIDAEEAGAATDMLSSEDIAGTIAQARREREAAIRARRAMHHVHEHEQAVDEVNAVSKAKTANAANVESAAQSTQAQVDEATSVAPDAQIVENSAVDELPQEADDQTHELASIKPAHTLDAFEMAVNQDLISFSLGAPRNGEEVPTAEPQSLPIVSLKQVSRAVPVEEQAHAQESAVDAQTGAEAEQVVDTKSSSDAHDGAQAESTAADEARADVRAIDETEVDAPEASVDSLGANVDAVLARRRG